MKNRIQTVRNHPVYKQNYGFYGHILCSCLFCTQAHCVFYLKFGAMCSFLFCTLWNLLSAGSFFMHTGTQTKYVSDADWCPAREYGRWLFFTRLHTGTQTKYVSKTDGRQKEDSSYYGK